MHTFSTLTKGESRVRVVNEASPLAGQLGTFVRKVTRSGEAWVRMDNEIPMEVQSRGTFRPDDSRLLHDDVLFPDEVEAVQ